MQRSHPIQTSFKDGEISPRLYGRVDLNRYANAVKECLNFIVLPQGGVSRRPGTHFVAEVKDSAARVRLIPFEFSDEQAYVIEAGNQYFRFYMDGGQIVTNPELIVNGTFDTTVDSWVNASDPGSVMEW